jgi:hypothetical protein
MAGRRTFHGRSLDLRLPVAGPSMAGRRTFHGRSQDLRWPVAGPSSNVSQKFLCAYYYIDIQEVVIDLSYVDGLLVPVDAGFIVDVIRLG